MTDRPEFADNRNGNTPAQAIRTILCIVTGIVATEIPDPASVVQIATVFFSSAGFANVSDYLPPVLLVRLLLGTYLAARTRNDSKRLDEWIEYFERRRMAASVRFIRRRSAQKRIYAPSSHFAHGVFEPGMRATKQALEMPDRISFLVYSNRDHREIKHHSFGLFERIEDLADDGAKQGVARQIPSFVT